MADITKYTPINGGTLFSDLKSHFSLLRARKTVAFVYGFMFVFVVCTVLLAFSPSPNSSSPWFTNVFSGAGSTSSGSSSAPIFSDASYRSHFSSIFSYFLPNSTKNSPVVRPSSSGITSSNATFDPPKPKTEPPVVNNQTQTQNPSHRADVQASNSPEPEKPSKNSTTSIAPATLSASNTNPNQTTIAATQNPPAPSNQTPIAVTQNRPAPSNQTTIGVTQNRPAPTNQTTIAATQNRPAPTNQISNSPPPSTVGKNITDNGENGVAEKATTSSNLTPPLLKKQSNDSTSGTPDLLKSLSKCDFYDGKWVRDESYPLYKPGSCPLIDEQFNCFLNGRPDHNYYKLKWKPNGCSLPRLNGSHMLELLRGKRLVFVGDSLNRNMWESLVCILRNSIKDQTKVYEEFGRHHFRTEASYSFIFEDYKCSVEFFVSPFLVQEWEMPENNGTTKETLRLDVIGRSADKYKKADVLVFNTGHWWTHEKTSRGKDYYQEGSHIYSELNVIEAFRKALTTWARWVDSNVNPSKTHVLFRGYSASHFSGGQWNSGGQCDNETEPIKNEAYLSSYPPKMAVLESVLKGMKNDVSYLNITRITDYRKDGHPSIYRKLIKNLSAEEKKSPVHYQDCSHWCLPGVPDAWNELLYAELLVKQYKKQQRKH